MSADTVRFISRQSHRKTRQGAESLVQHRPAAGLHAAAIITLRTKSRLKNSLAQTFQGDSVPAGIRREPDNHDCPVRLDTSGHGFRCRRTAGQQPGRDQSKRQYYPRNRPPDFAGLFQMHPVSPHSACQSGSTLVQALMAAYRAIRKNICRSAMSTIFCRRTGANNF